VIAKRKKTSLRLVHTLSAARGVGPCIVSPAHGRFPRDIADALALAPIHNVNELLLASCTSPAPPAAEIYAGIFAADPFALWVDVRDRLQQCDIAGVANFPSITAISGQLGTSLGSLGFGLADEMRRLQWFADQGFSVAAAVRSVADLASVLNIDPRIVIVLEDWGLLGKRDLRDLRDTLAARRTDVFRFDASSLTFEPF